MALKPEYEKAYSTFVVMGIFTLAVNIYYYAYPLWAAMGLTHPIAVRLFLKMRGAGFFATPLYTKGVALLLSMLTVMTRHGRRNELAWWQTGIVVLVGALLYFVPFGNPIIYAAASITGYGTMVLGVSLALYKLTGFIKKKNDFNETFRQCEEKIETENSINLMTCFQYKGKRHTGWINFVNPFRGTMVLGTPGSGKSFSVYIPFMEQMMRKGYSMFVYDYKYPALTYDAFNMLSQNMWCYDRLGMKRPMFCVVNFKDPRYSLRCNPLNPQYIRSLTDCTEIADVIMKNLAETDKKDFFTQSAQLFIDCCTSFLWVYENGRYCSFPHLVELMCHPAEHVIELISGYPELQTKVASFKEALQKKANEQLAGQTSSATVPVAGMSTPSLYWVLSGDDFTLDINNPDEPKIVCVGNDPDNQATYGAALALFFSRLFKLVNHPGKLKSAILLDEAPTVVIKGLDNLIATARSNKVAVVLGGQDKTQFIRDYGEKYANVIFNTVGNIISGQVNGRTAEELSKMFGREFRERQSQTLSDDNESIQLSFSQEELMPVNKIETLSQGTFFGKVADDFDAKIEHKLFCGEIVVDTEAMKARKAASRPLPCMTSFGEAALTKSIMEGDMKETALRHFAITRIKDKGVNDSITESDIQKELKSASGKDKTAFLSQYARTYVRMHIDAVIEDNYHRIKDDISMILQSHGIGQESEMEEPPETGLPESKEDTAEDAFGPADGIVEETVPDIILPVDDEYEE